MKNQNLWTPTKFDKKNGSLIASRNEAHVSVGSRFVTGITAEFYASEIPKSVSGTLLDLGCGKAPLYIAYSEYANSVICVDWEATVSTTSHLDHNCDLNEGIPLADDTVDTIILSDVLEHIYEPKSLCKEMQRVLRPGGRLIGNVPFHYWIHAAPHDYHRYTRFALLRYLTDAGFGDIRIQESGGVLDVLTDIFCKLLPKIPLVGKSISKGLHTSSNWFRSTRLWRRHFSATKEKFPLGYFFYAICAEK